jgi:hypothetical protein
VERGSCGITCYFTGVSLGVLKKPRKMRLVKPVSGPVYESGIPHYEPRNAIRSTGTVDSVEMLLVYYNSGLKGIQWHQRSH